MENIFSLKKKILFIWLHWVLVAAPALAQNMWELSSLSSLTKDWTRIPDQGLDSGFLTSGPPGKFEHIFLNKFLEIMTAPLKNCFFLCFVF